MPALIDLVGRRFGQLEVIGKGARSGRPLWACRCDCGASVQARSGDLTMGKTTRCRSCRDRFAKNRHGYTSARGPSPTYRSWQSMKQRCINPSATHYHRYGGRGITVCDRWRESFVNFLADMGERPSLAHTIDRLDNDGPYSPENCRWATRHEQTRRGHRVLANIRPLTHEGETLSVAEWAERKGIRPQTLALRLRRGWSVERALTTPVR